MTEPTNEDIARALGWTQTLGSTFTGWWIPAGINDPLLSDLISPLELPDFATAEMCDRWIIPDIERRWWDYSILTIGGKSDACVYPKGFMESTGFDDEGIKADTPWRALVLAWWRAVESEKEGKS